MKELTLNMVQNICFETKNMNEWVQQNMSGLIRNGFKTAGYRYNRQALNQDSANFWSWVGQSAQFFCNVFQCSKFGQ